MCVCVQNKPKKPGFFQDFDGFRHALPQQAHLYLLRSRVHDRSGTSRVPSIQYTDKAARHRHCSSNKHTIAQQHKTTAHTPTILPRARWASIPNMYKSNQNDSLPPRVTLCMVVASLAALMHWLGTPSSLLTPPTPSALLNSNITNTQASCGVVWCDKIRCNGLRTRVHLKPSAKI